MKTLINISFLLIVLNKITLPQFYADSVTPEYVIEFWKIADESIAYIKDYDIPKGFTERELSHIMKLYFQCYDKNPVGFYGYLKEISRERISYSMMAEELIPQMKVDYLRNQIAYKYGISFTEVISTPAFLRCKYIDDNLSSLDTVQVSSTPMKVYFHFIIEEVLKGEKFFKQGDTIIINIIVNPILGGLGYPPSVFEKMKSYLIPLKPFIVYSDEYDGANAIVNINGIFDDWVMGIPLITFPIDNEIIRNCEYFGIKNTSWTDFKKYFKDTYLIFK